MPRAKRYYIPGQAYQISYTWIFVFTLKQLYVTSK